MSYPRDPSAGWKGGEPTRTMHHGQAGALTQPLPRGPYNGEYVRGAHEGPPNDGYSDDRYANEGYGPNDDYYPNDGYYPDDGYGPGGYPPKLPWWSNQRLLLAIAVAVVVVGGGFYAAYYFTQVVISTTPASSPALPRGVPSAPAAPPSAEVPAEPSQEPSADPSPSASEAPQNVAPFQDSDLRAFAGRVGRNDSQCKGETSAVQTITEVVTCRLDDDATVRFVRFADDQARDDYKATVRSGLDGRLDIDRDSNWSARGRPQGTFVSGGQDGGSAYVFWDLNSAPIIGELIIPNEDAQDAERFWRREL